MGNPTREKNVVWAVVGSVFGGVKKLLLLVYLWAKIYICLDEI